MTTEVRATVVEAHAALDQANHALEAALTAERESSAWVDAEREDVATGDTARRSGLIKAQRQLRLDEEARFQAEAGVRKRERELEQAQEAERQAAHAEFYAARAQLAAAYEARRSGVRSLMEDLAKLIGAAKDSLDELAEHEQHVRAEFGKRGVTAPLVNVRRLDRDPHLYGRLLDAIEHIHQEYR